MRTAIIHNYLNKIILCEGSPWTATKIIAITYGEKIQIRLSLEQDKWLITVYSKGIATADMFTDCIQQGNY